MKLNKLIYLGSNISYNESYFKFEYLKHDWSTIWKSGTGNKIKQESF